MKLEAPKRFQLKGGHPPELFFESSFSFVSYARVVKSSLTGGFDFTVVPSDPGADAFFAGEDHAGLQEVHLGSKNSVESIQRLYGFLALVPVVTDVLPDDGEVLLRGCGIDRSSWKVLSE